MFIVYHLWFKVIVVLLWSICCVVCCLMFSNDQIRYVYYFHSTCTRTVFESTYTYIMHTYTEFASLQLWHVENRQSHIKEIEAQCSECSLKFEGLCKSFEYMKSKEYTTTSYLYILFLLLVNPKHMLYFDFIFHNKRCFVCFIASTNWTQIHTYFYIIVIPKQLQLIVVVKEKNEINPHKYLKMCSHHLYNKRQTTIDLFECFST
jgi:hypothetical protein